jgi:hypothetical protein
VMYHLQLYALAKLQHGGKKITCKGWK